MPNLDALSALAWCGAIAGVGVAISSLEILVSWRHYASGGLFDGDLLCRTSGLQRHPLARRLLGWLFTLGGINALAVTRLVCGLALTIVTLGAGWRAIAAAVAFVTGGLIVWRNRYGTDGSDQMTAIVLAGVAIGSCFSFDPVTQTAAIAFIAAQACLAYFVAGVAKAHSPFWRSGDVIGPIMQTETWGSRSLAAWLIASRPRAWLASWMVIGAECLFPLVLIAPPWMVAVFIGWGLAFHAFCAIGMGLNTFFWAFVAAYPAIFYIRSVILAAL
jgi:hypothetical protein